MHPHPRPLLAAGAAALLLVTGCSDPATPDPTPSPASVTSSEPESGEPRPSGGGSTVPADAGDLADITLPLENAPTPEGTAVQSVTWAPACSGSGISIAALDHLTGSRVRVLEVPEGVEGQGLLQFAAEADADAFLEQVAAGYASCPDPGPARDGFRERIAAGPMDDAVPTVAVRTWTEQSEDGSAWREVPGGSVDLFAQKGRFVALTWSGGEYVGDSLDTLTAQSDLRQASQQILEEV
ncbi:MAG: hypothetical protein ACK5LS_12435 [Propioniciclava sp.]